MSRLTFRKADTRVAWQKQLRDQFADEGVPPVPHLDLKLALVRPVSRRVAEQIILKYEWLGTMGPGTNFHYGIFFGNYCAGVCCFCVGGGGANIYAYKEFGLSSARELAYLARGANVHWAPVGTNSKLVSWSCRLIAKDSGCKIALAYADTDAGEIGTIYQACNWVHIGKGSSTRQWVSPTGRVLDQKLPHNLMVRDGRRRTRMDYVRALRAAGWREQATNPKYRYVYILDRNDKALVARIERMAKPYPKRAPLEGQKGPPSVGGSIPTRTLQKKSNGKDKKESKQERKPKAHAAAKVPAHVRRSAASVQV